MLWSARIDCGYAVVDCGDDAVVNCGMTVVGLKWTRVWLRSRFVLKTIAVTPIIFRWSSLMS